jgi:hypothetical protein
VLKVVFFRLHAVQVLRLVCSCLQNAPASDTWDLSSLLVNGSPVSQAVVEAVLSVIYSGMGALNYEMDRTSGQYSLSQLLDMLLFADAVGCSRAVLAQLAGLLGSTVEPQLEVSLVSDERHSEDSSSRGGRGGRRGRGGRGGRGSRGATPVAAAAAAAGADRVQDSVLLHLAGVYSIAAAVDAEDSDDADDDNLALWRWHGHVRSFMRLLTRQQQQQLCECVAQQLEALLFVGFKLDLQQLLQPALRFLRAHAETLLSDVLKNTADVIFTQRVVASANGANGAELLSRACVQRPLGLGFGIGSVFGDVEYMDDEEDEDALNFTATLLQDLHVFCKGTRVEVRRRGLLLQADELSAAACCVLQLQVHIRTCKGAAQPST